MGLEVCVESAGSLSAAIAGGADRIELCSALDLGGLTPSPGLMALAARAPVPVVAMIRPQAGGFQMSDDDLEVMKSDIAAAVLAGLDGVVFGVLGTDMRLDLPAMKALVDAAQGLDCILHRAFDLIPDQGEALEQAIDLSLCRILTSGGAKRADLGTAQLARLHQQARGRVTIMPGCGVTPETLQDILQVPYADIHASCSRPVVMDAPLVCAGFARKTGRICDAEQVRALRQALIRLR